MQTTTTQGSPKFVPPAERIATFDQDGTLWVEHPMYTQVMYCLERVPAVVKAKPELANVEPFKTVHVGRSRGHREAHRAGPLQDPRCDADRHVGRDVQCRGEEVDRRRRRIRAGSVPTRSSTYQPMQEVLKYFRANGYKTYIVTGGGQDFVRVYSEADLWHPARAGRRHCRRNEVRLWQGRQAVSDERAEAAAQRQQCRQGEGIHLMIGRRPHAAFGNSAGDRQMLEYTGAGDGARLMMLVLHDDAKREYAYGPAQGLRDTRSAHSPRRYTTRRRKTAGPSSA